MDRQGYFFEGSVAFRVLVFFFLFVSYYFQRYPNYCYGWFLADFAKGEAKGWLFFGWRGNQVPGYGSNCTA